VGPAAIPRSYCSLDGEPAPGWRAAASYGWLASTLRFDGGVEADFTQHSALASISRRLGERVTLQLGAGAVVGGDIQAAGATERFRPGLALQAGVTWLPLDGRAGPFLALTATLAATFASTEAAGGALTSYRALDAGLAAAVGWPLFGWLAPYLGGKVFGGPVDWRLGGVPVTGTDVHHWQLGLGAAALLPGGFDLQAEVSPLGARSATLAVGRPF